ncbi:MAG: YicC/YloC family endoribonuclease [Leadbetterella sp.]
MIQSMTGFGSANLETESLSISVEVKSLNSKFSDIYCRITKAYSSKEIEVRNIIQKELERGKVEFTLAVNPKDAEHAGTSINRPLIKAYFKDLSQTASELGFEPNPTDILRMATLMPNAYQTSILNKEEADKEWEIISGVIHSAIKSCKEFRSQEGKNTQEKLLEYATNIEDGLNRVIEADVTRIPSVRERLQKAVTDYVGSENFDKNRFEQELIYYIEKFDISEEKVRLRNHLEYFRKELDSETNGKKLNFLAQEIGREINTIGSKANDSNIQKIVVFMKDELEKIKEQSLNIL